MKTQAYRYITGSLYKYNEETKSYVHVYRAKIGTKTKAQAIKQYKNEYFYGG
jgi:hypothetical protein